MVGLCFGSLAALAGLLGLFGICWYRGRQNDMKRKKTIPEKEEHTNELTI